MTTAIERVHPLSSLVLATLWVVSLAGCATAGPVTSQPIEGPVGPDEIAAVDGPRCAPITSLRTVVARPTFNASWQAG